MSDAKPETASAIRANCWYCGTPGFLYHHADGHNLALCDACRDAGQPDPARAAFIQQVRETVRLCGKTGNHIDRTVREFFTNCPGIDAYATAHGWPATLEALAEALRDPCAT